ncbi:MAG: hypothetical protein IT534_13230 [Bauldia sp.]|nr:hypothetical protein [Bauldia sp.]
MPGNIFQGAFSAVAVAGAQDVFEITAAATHIVDLREVRLGQYSDAGDTAAEMLSVEIIRGHTTSGSGGAALAIHTLQGAGAPASSVEANNTTLASNGVARTMLADSFAIAGGFRWRPPADERIQIQPGERAVVRISAPADALTMNGTIVIEEHRL